MVLGVKRKSELRIVRAGAGAPTDAADADRSNLAVSAQDAVLRYPIGAYARASLKSAILSLVGHRDAAPKRTYVDAIRGINLHITTGERVALIGANGSGKSSLLRALAGIYPLASGSLTVVGRIGALLDIGLGFEPEATGRENIYYRGMAMGYSRKDLRAVESEIVRFADLGEFIDMPMRIYSAGMFVRLGFSISTQFTPDILLVDEAFGAGDATFAQRALTRIMRIVNESGIFVIATHDLPFVEHACQRAIWLQNGLIRLDGAPGVVLPEYQRHMLAEVASNP